MAADIKEALIQYCDVKQEYDDIRTRRDTLKRDIERMEKEQISVIDSVTGGNGGIQHYKIEGYPYPEYSRKRTLLIARDNQLQVYEIKLLEITNEVDELYGDTKDDKWKQEEIARLKAEQGISNMKEPALNMQADGFTVDGADNNFIGFDNK